MAGGSCHRGVTNMNYQHPCQYGKAQRLEGEIPSPSDPPPWYLFHTRCPHATARCKTKVPTLANTDGAARVVWHHCKELLT